MEKGKVIRRAALIAAVVAALGLLALFGPVYTVGEQEQAVVTTFGAVTSTEEAGAHLRIPLIYRVQKVPAYITQKMYIGYDYSQSGYMISNEDESRIMTGDDNIVLMDYFLEWRISDPVAYLYHSDSPADILKGVAQACARNYVGSAQVDAILTSGKEEAQTVIRDNIRESLEAFDIGVQIVDVKIQDVEPPNDAVAAAFKAVEDAKQKRETTITQANTYSESQIPAAKSEADRIAQEAEANYQSRIALATGEAARFNAMYAQYAKFPEVTRTRMYLEMLESLLPMMKIYINTTENGSTMMIPVESLLTVGAPAPADAD
ncbi:MAG: FtsH protease activity modulator HflK [Oscillospiraceae bacterium]|nr:FtsH protease activity modulator HflK [Oscillospiraceae bacterium]